MIETFWVFVGIIAVVVVAIIGTIGIAQGTNEFLFLATILIALPIILVVIILTLLYGIRELVLKAPQTPRK